MWLIAATFLLGCQHGRSANDYHPRLDKGRPGNPGLKLKVNQKAFDYASQMAGQLVAEQLPNLEIPTIQQSISAVNGYLQVYDLCITGFRPPTQTKISPSGPNRINIDISDLDVR